MSNTRKPEQKSIKKEIIFADAAFLVLGFIMTIIPGYSKGIICTASGILIGIWGILKLVMYFTSNKASIPFSSYGIVPGASSIVFSVILIVSNEIVADAVIKVLALILIISAILKVQYTIEFIKLKEKNWYVPLIGAAIAITLGALVLFEVFDYNKTGVWRFLGISFLVTGGWDIIAVTKLASITEKLESKKNKKESDAPKKEKAKG